MISLTHALDHGEEATTHLKAFIGEHYASSNEPAFKTLYMGQLFLSICRREYVRSFILTSFIIIAGEIVIFKNKQG